MNNNRFTVPIAFAVALHATLLFGFHRSPAVRTVKSAAPVLPAPPERIEMTELEKPPVRNEENEPPPKGSPHVDRPEIEDAPRILKPRDIEISTKPPMPRSPLKDSRFDTLPPGFEGGVEGGLKFDGKGIISAMGLDNPPNARVQVSPDYPFSARNEGLEGEVLVEFLVDESGRVSNPIVIRSTSRVFEEPSLRAVTKWRFEPGKRDGRIVRFRMAVPVMFRLGTN